MNSIYEILSENPTLSICLGFVLAVIIMILFKDVIKEYIRKKYDLYTETEIVKAIKLGEQDQKLVVTEMKGINNISTLILNNLKRIKKMPTI